MDDKKAEVRFVALATRVRKHTHTHTGLQAHGIQRNSTPARRLVSAFTSLFESKTSEVRTIPRSSASIFYLFLIGSRKNRLHR